MEKEFLLALFRNSLILGLGVYLFSALVLIFFKDHISLLHSHMFGLPEKEIKREYFRFLANFKMILLVFIWMMN